jgi:hypothetical protein
MHTRYRLFVAAILLVGAATPPTPLTPATMPAPLISGWSPLKEGTAEGTVEIDAKNATNLLCLNPPNNSRP